MTNDRFTDDPYADREALASLLEQAERERDEWVDKCRVALLAQEQAERELIAEREDAERIRLKLADRLELVDVFPGTDNPEWAGNE